MQIIVVISRPHTSNAARYEALVSNLKSTISLTEGAEALSDNVFLIREQSGLSTFGAVVALAHEQQVPYRVLFLEKMDEWQS
jgi:hypothetical protein